MRCRIYRGETKKGKQVLCQLRPQITPLFSLPRHFCSSLRGCIAPVRRLASLLFQTTQRQPQRLGALRVFYCYSTDAPLLKDEVFPSSLLLFRCDRPCLKLHGIGDCYCDGHAYCRQPRHQPHRQLSQRNYSQYELDLHQARSQASRLASTQLPNCTALRLNPLRPPA